MIIPWQELAADTLQNLLEEHVSRDGTDYGEQEIPLATRAGQVHEALRRQQLLIWFDENSQSASLVAKDQALLLQAELLQAELLQKTPTQDASVEDGSTPDGVL